MRLFLAGACAIFVASCSSSSSAPSTDGTGAGGSAGANVLAGGSAGAKPCAGKGQDCSTGACCAGLHCSVDGLCLSAPAGSGGAAACAAAGQDCSSASCCAALTCSPGTQVCTNGGGSWRACNFPSLSTCTAAYANSPAAAAALDKKCTDTPLASCPTSGLVGCCKSATDEVCYYGTEPLAAVHQICDQIMTPFSATP